ncbi:MAG: hypothetical protein ACREME_11885, partial [Gemmatimonadales bacterium]
MVPPPADLLAALAALRERLQEIPQADDRRLQALRTELLGRKAGALTAILKALPTLDADTRARVRGELHELLDELELPTLLVTHDFEDAAALAGRIGVLVDGRLL